eukprot:jgi/Tetstr1/420476/TSEL_011589.t1
MSVIKAKSTDARILPDDMGLPETPIASGPLTVYPLQLGDRPQAVVVTFAGARLGNVFQNKEGPPSYSFEVDNTDGLKALNQELCDMIEVFAGVDKENWVPLVKRDRYLTVKPADGFKGELRKGRSYKIAVRLASVWKHGERAGASLKLVQAREVGERCLVR